MGITVEDALARLTSPYQDTQFIGGDAFPMEFDAELAGESNNYKLAKAIVDGFWGEISTNITDLRRETNPETMTQGSLDRYGRFIGVKRNVGESDAEYRIRLKNAVKQRRGGTSHASILEFAESLLGATPGDIKLFENEDSNDAYRMAFFRVEVAIETLENLGFTTPAEQTDIVNTLQSALKQISAAGIDVEVVTPTGDVYDTATYDSGQYG